MSINCTAERPDGTRTRISVGLSPVSNWPVPEATVLSDQVAEAVDALTSAQVDKLGRQIHRAGRIVPHARDIRAGGSRTLAASHWCLEELSWCPVESGEVYEARPLVNSTLLG